MPGKRKLARRGRSVVAPRAGKAYGRLKVVLVFAVLVLGLHAQAVEVTVRGIRLQGNPLWIEPVVKEDGEQRVGEGDHATEVPLGRGRPEGRHAPSHNAVPAHSQGGPIQASDAAAKVKLEMPKVRTPPTDPSFPIGRTHASCNPDTLPRREGSSTGSTLRTAAALSNVGGGGIGGSLPRRLRWELIRLAWNWRGSRSRLQSEGVVSVSVAVFSKKNKVPLATSVHGSDVALLIREFGRHVSG
jgi:hypothetical protein